MSIKVNKNIRTKY